MLQISDIIPYSGLYCFSKTDSPTILNVTAEPAPVCEGCSVTLNCNVSGHPSPYVAWINEKGAVLQNSTNVTSYRISEVTRKEEGEYICKASNTVGEDVASTGILDVQCKFVRK